MFRLILAPVLALICLLAVSVSHAAITVNSVTYSVQAQSGALWFHPNNFQYISTSNTWSASGMASPGDVSESSGFLEGGPYPGFPWQAVYSSTSYASASLSIDLEPTSITMGVASYIQDGLSAYNVSVNFDVTGAPALLDFGAAEADYQLLYGDTPTVTLLYNSNPVALPSWDNVSPFFPIPFIGSNIQAINDLLLPVGNYVFTMSAHHTSADFNGFIPALINKRVNVSITTAVPEVSNLFLCGLVAVGFLACHRHRGALVGIVRGL